MWATPRKTYRKNGRLPLGTFSRRISLKRRGLNLSAFGVRMSQLSPGLLMSVHRTIQTHGPSADEPMTPQGQLWLTINWQISSGIGTVTASGATMLEGVLQRERLVLT